jgi:hypothetical protein
LKRFLQRILQEIMKKKILGTSDAWSTSHLSQGTSKPAYYILDCRISKEKMLSGMTWHLFFGDLNQSGKNSEIKPPLARGQKEEGQTLSQDVDCLMGSYMPPCPPWTD